MKKTILITGSSSGIGKETAKKFAGEGWNVIATMRSPEKETELVSMENVLVTKLDVQDEKSVQAGIEAGIQRYGKIDTIVNNAGFGLFGLFEAATQEQVKEQFDVNVFGVMNVIRAILPHFRHNGNGMIINISSGAGRFSLPLLSSYNASKYALEGFSESLSYELSSQNIRVKIIEPGGTETNFGHVAQQRYAVNNALNDYDAFTSAAGKMFTDMFLDKITAASVADVIYKAATDGLQQMRYIAGTASYQKRVADGLRLPDDVYIAEIKKLYEPFLPA